MTALDPLDRELLDFLCACIHHRCKVRSVKGPRRASLKRLRYAGLVWFEGFTPSPSAMVEWRDRLFPRSPASPGGALSEQPPCATAADKAGGAAARLSCAAPPKREPNVSAFDLLKEIRAWLAANPKCTETNFSCLALGRPAALSEIKRSGTVRPKTARRVREFIANPPAEAFNRKRGPKGPRKPKTDETPRPFVAPKAAKPKPDPVLRAQRAVAKGRRVTTSRAMARIEQGLNPRGAKQAAVRHAQFAIERQMEIDTRLGDPIEQAKHALRKLYTPVLSAETTGGPAGHFYVGRKLVDQAELLQMAGRLVA